MDLELLNILHVAERYICCRWWDTALRRWCSSSFAKTPGSLRSSRTISLDHLSWNYNLGTKSKTHLEAFYIILSLDRPSASSLEYLLFFVAAGIGRGNSSTPWALAKVAKDIQFMYYICNSRKLLANLSLKAVKKPSFLDSIRDSPPKNIWLLQGY